MHRGVRIPRIRDREYHNSTRWKSLPLIGSAVSSNAIIIVISCGSSSITLGHESSTGLRYRVLEAGIVNERIYEQDLMRVLSKNVEV